MDTDRVEEVLRRAHMTRRDILRRAGVGGLALTAPGVLAACGSDNKSSSGTAGGSASTSNEPIEKMTWVLEQVSSLNAPTKDYGGMIPAVIATEPIMTYDDKQNLVGHLAESSEVVDPVTYVYKVRQGVKYWDGSLMTAEDIAYAISRHLDPKVGSQLAGLIPEIASVKVTGDDEVTVKLKKPNATWAQIPTSMFVAPKAFFERLGNDFGTTKPNSIMGTGAYKVVEFKPNELVRYVANDDYWGPKPTARNLEIRVIRDSQVAVLAAKSGEIDATFDPPGETLSDWKGLPDFTLTSVPSGNVTFVAMDMTFTPYDDLHLRRAMAYAMDREGLLKAILKGNGEITDSIVARSQFGGSVPKEKLDEIYNSLPKYDYDLDKAKAEFAQSKYAPSVVAKAWFYSDNTASQQILVTWAEALAKIGIQLKFSPVELDAGAEREDGHHDLQLHLDYEWGADYADPADFPVVLLPTYAAKPHLYNEANYKNPEMDKLLDENLQGTDPVARAEVLAKVMRLAQEDVPYIPMWTPYTTVAIKKGLQYKAYSGLHRQQPWMAHVSKA